eukprot:6182127-Pleurochrysis_carterae.AAC.4
MMLKRLHEVDNNGKDDQGIQILVMTLYLDVSRSSSKLLSSRALLRPKHQLARKCERVFHHTRVVVGGNFHSIDGSTAIDFISTRTKNILYSRIIRGQCVPMGHKVQQHLSEHLIRRAGCCCFEGAQFASRLCSAVAGTPGSREPALRCPPPWFALACQRVQGEGRTCLHQRAAPPLFSFHCVLAVCLPTFQHDENMPDLQREAALLQSMAQSA